MNPVYIPMNPYTYINLDFRTTDADIFDKNYEQAKNWQH
jgi:hypothetical protein